MLTRERIKIILEESPLETAEPNKIQKWLEQVLFHVLLEESLSMNEILHEKADKIDIKVLIERSDEKFASIQKEMNTRFEALQKEMNTRFEALQKEMDTRFEALQKEMNTRFEAMNTRFEALQKEMNTRFEAMNTRFEALQKQMDARFEAVEKRLGTMQWIVTIAFSVIVILNALYGFFKR